MDKVTVLKRLLRAVQVAAVTIKCLYADTAFCSIPVLRFLLIGVALLIVNMWIGCTGCISASPVKGHAAWRGSTFVWNG